MLDGERVNENASGGVCACMHLCVWAWVNLYQVLNKFFKVKDWDYFIYLLPGKVFYFTLARSI